MHYTHIPPTLLGVKKQLGNHNKCFTLNTTQKHKPTHAVVMRHRPVFEWLNSRRRWTTMATLRCECCHVASSLKLRADFRESWRAPGSSLVNWTCCCNENSTGFDLNKELWMVLTKLLRHCEVIKYLSLGIININYRKAGCMIVSYSFCVESCTIIKAGCKTAANTSEAFISCCKFGHTCCHHNFYNSKTNGSYNVNPITPRGHSFERKGIWNVSRPMFLKTALTLGTNGSTSRKVLR